MNCCATHWLHKLGVCLKFVTAIVVGVFFLYLQEVVVIFICSGISRFLHCDHHLILRKCCDVLGTGCFFCEVKEEIHKHDNYKFFLSLWEPLGLKCYRRSGPSVGRYMRFVQKVSELTTIHEVDKACGVLTLIVFNIVPFRGYILCPTFLPLLETFCELLFRDV